MLVDGTVVGSTKNNYVVINMLGEGGFGAVYKVHDEKDETKLYAMKVEKKLETRQHSKLKMEIAILKSISDFSADQMQPEEVRKRAEKHFTVMIDRGKKPDFFFLIMELVGSSLSDLKQKASGRHLSLVCGLGASKQCLESVQVLHLLGYIHRDIKPANFAVGRDPKQHVIYILDFGIARRVVKDNKEIKTPRIRVGFKGTVRYASAACHANIEVYYRDDCESWLYMLMDLVSPNGLPWQRMSDKIDVGRCKEMIRASNSMQERFLSAAGAARTEIASIFEYIVSESSIIKPDYNYIYALLDDGAVKCGVKDADEPFDWEMKRDANSMRRRRDSQVSKMDRSRHRDRSRNLGRDQEDELNSETHKPSRRSKSNN